MQIQVNTDNHIPGHEELATTVRLKVEKALAHFSEQITRVEVHLSDENSGQKKGPDDMRCLLETRLEGSQPLAVTHQASTMRAAVDGAVDKMVRALTTRVGRQRDRRRQAD